MTDIVLALTAPLITLDIEPAIGNEFTIDLVAPRSFCIEAESSKTIIVIESAD